MALSDPFAQTYQGSFEAGQSLGQGIQSAASSVADVMKQKAAVDQQNKQRQQAFGMLQQFGLVKQNQPTNDDLANGLKDYGQKAGVEVNVNHGDNPDQEKKNMVGIYKALGIPLPKGKIDVMPGTTMDFGGGASYTAPKKEKSVAEQVGEYQEAQKMLGDSGNPSVSPTGGVSIKGNSGAIKDIQGTAKDIVKGMQDGTLPPTMTGMSRTAGLSAAIEQEAAKQGYNLKQAQTDYLVNKTGAQNFEKTYNTMQFAHDRFDLNRKYALEVGKEINEDTAPVLKRAFINGEKELQGNVAAARVYAALYPVALEYSRLTTGNGVNGNMTDSARDEGLKLVNYGLTNGQLDGLIGDKGVLTTDGENTMKALENTRNKISSRNNNPAQQTLNAAGMGGKSQQQDSSDPMGLR